MRKKIDFVKSSFRIRKDLHDFIIIETKNTHKTGNTIVNSAIEEYLKPSYKINHELETKYCLNAVLKRLIDNEKALHLITLLIEEFARTFYSNTQSVEHQNNETQIKRVSDSMENLYSKIEVSISGKKKSILNRFLSIEHNKTEDQGTFT